MSDILLRFIHISDTHIHPDLNYNKPYALHPPMLGIEGLIDAVNTLPFQPDFILHTGDIAYDPDPEVYPLVRATLKRFKAPVYVLAGNHDHQLALQQVVMQRAESDLQSHLHYEFEHNGVQFICLDSNGPAAEVPAGHIPDDQLQWLQNLCRADDPRPLVIAVHHQPLAIGSAWLDDEMRIRNGEAFHAALLPARGRLRGVFHGHIHQNLEVLHDGVLYSAAASSWCQFNSYTIANDTTVTGDFGTRPGFSVVTITRRGMVIRRHAYRI